jgi:hypothetical protein
MRQKYHISKQQICQQKRLFLGLYPKTGLQSRLLTFLLTKSLNDSIAKVELPGWSSANPQISFQRLAGRWQHPPARVLIAPLPWKWRNTANAEEYATKN